jgi:hypothetical protein
MSKNTIFKELMFDSEVHSIGENGIMFGMNLNYGNNDLLLDPTYVTYSYKQVSQVYLNDSSGNFKRTKTTIDTHTCGIDSFDNVDDDTITSLGIDKYYCPTYRNYTVAGNFYSNRYDYIELKFYKCNPAYSSVT